MWSWIKFMSMCESTLHVTSCFSFYVSVSFWQEDLHCAHLRCHCSLDHLNHLRPSFSSPLIRCRCGCFLWPAVQLQFAFSFSSHLKDLALLALFFAASVVQWEPKVPLAQGRSYLREGSPLHSNTMVSQQQILHISRNMSYSLLCL